MSQVYKSKSLANSDGATSSRNIEKNGALEPVGMDVDAEDSDPALILSPVQIQQEFYENLPECDWVRYLNARDSLSLILRSSHLINLTYEFRNRKHLLQNIAFALYGCPSTEGDLTDIFSDIEAHLEGYTSRQKEVVMKVYQKICDQSKYSQNDEDLYVSILLIVCARPKPLKLFQKEPTNYWVDLHIKNNIDVWTTAIFRIRKCIPTLVDAKPCRLFIDEHARVYNSWEDYLKNNSADKCVLIVPENGQYSGIIVEGEDQFRVKLSVVPSPALGLKSRVLSTVDTASTIASLGAIGVLGVAAFTPVAPIVLAGAAVATVSTGIYGLVRSSLHLQDRREHDQTISPTDGEARGSWLNIAASTVGLAAGAASQLLSRSAAAGTNLTKTGRALAVSVDVLRHANLITGGAGVFHSVFHMVVKYRNHGEAPTKLELFQFTAATLFFFNAVVSNKTAQTVIEEAQSNTINEYRSSLRSNRHRRIFDKLSAESRRVQGKIQGNTEVIRGIKNIVNKDQYFADVLRINKDVNQHKLKISMTADGKVNINAQHKFSPSELQNLGREGRTKLFTEIGPAGQGPQNVSTRLTSPRAAVGRYYDDDDTQNNNTLVGIHPGEILRIGSLLVRVSSSGAENIALLLENLSQDLYANLMTVCFNILSNLLPGDIAKLRLLSPDEDLVLQIVRFVFNYMKHERPLGEASENDNGIVHVLKEFFQEGVVRQDTILRLKDQMLRYVDEEIDKRRAQFPNKKQVICKTCNGVRFA